MNNDLNEHIMSVIRLTKEFSFEAAHMLEGYDGPCREIHGHSYKLFAGRMDRRSVVCFSSMAR